LKRRVRLGVTTWIRTNPLDFIRTMTSWTLPVELRAFPVTVAAPADGV